MKKEKEDWKVELDHNKIKGYKPADKRIEYSDINESGLKLRISKAGTKTFFYRYRIGDRIRRFKIGEFPAVSLADARKKVRSLKVDVDNGLDPQAEKDQRKKELAKAPEILFLFSDLCEKYKKRHLPTLRPKTKIEYQRIIDNELIPVIGKRPVKEIERKELIDLLDAVAYDRGKTTLSNRIRATLSSIYSFGIDRDIVQANPILNIKRKKNEVKRDRVYSESEIKALWKAFEDQAEPVQSIYKMLILLGQRSGETRRMKWADIDINKQLWVIPKEETKANRTHIVPLPEMALNILENLKPLTGKSEYVFPSPKNNGQPIKWLQKANKRIVKATKINDFRIHDLRRTMASYIAELGTDRTVLGKLINHKSLSGDDQVTAIYDRYDYMKEKRIAINKWCLKIDRIINPSIKSSSIVKIA